VTDRVNIASGSAWEDRVGYSRAVRVGDHVWVSGTTATDEAGQVVDGGDLYRQAVRALSNVERALERAGAGLADVVRTRIYVTDIRRWEEVALAHGNVFATIRPAATMVEVRALIDPRMLIEIEVDAIIGGHA
jgi:enamine deaminase RidA (YjgF/YER057c/UK114 family)